MEQNHMIPSVFDGAGAIEKIVGDEKVERLQDKVDDMQNQVAAGKMQAVDVAEFMRKMRTKPVVRDYKKIGRNDPCPCGAVDENGKPKKYKNCCLRSGKYETRHQIGE